MSENASIERDSLLWKVLRVIAERPGELDIAAIADRVFPPPPIGLPAADAGHFARAQAYAAWRAQEVGEGGRRGRREAARLDVAQALVQLREQDLVKPQAGPQIAPWWLAQVEKTSLERALARAYPKRKRKGKAPKLPTHLAMIRKIVREAPDSIQTLLGEKASQARRQAFQDLVAWSILVLPSCCWPTEAGSILVLGTALVPVPQNTLPSVLTPAAKGGGSLRPLRTEADQDWAVEEINKLRNATPDSPEGARREILEVLLLAALGGQR